LAEDFFEEDFWQGDFRFSVFDFRLGKGEDFTEVSQENEGTRAGLQAGADRGLDGSQE
jgi:hypothetical protein